jgi:N-methylhydantoinase B/oxoprolinase/acetone carboxylase alpha subunit
VRKEQFTAREQYVARDRKTVEFIQTLGGNRTDDRQERRISSTRIGGHMAGAELSGLPVVHVRKSQTNAVFKEIVEEYAPSAQNGPGRAGSPTNVGQRVIRLAWTRSHRGRGNT